MNRKEIFKTTQLALMAVTVGFGIAACTGAFDDPFVSPKTGVTYPSQSLNLSEVSTRKVIFLRVGSKSDTYVESNGVTLLKEGERVNWTEIAVADQQGQSHSRSQVEIVNANTCANDSPDVQELLASYKSLTAVCDSKLIKALESASSVIITPANANPTLFTSWGFEVKNLGLTYAMIYTFTL
jgi:hypothetical protein